MKQPYFHNGDLRNDFPRLMDEPALAIGRDKIDNDGEPYWYLDVDDRSYSYGNEKERDADYITLVKALDDEL